MVHWRGKGKPIQYFALRTPWTVWKGKNDRILKDDLPGLVDAQHDTGDRWRITPERMKKHSQSKNNSQLWMWLVMEVKLQCSKEHYCIGTWKVRSMNQGKLEVVTQEMARVNIDISGISELKWTGMGEFNSDDHYIDYCWQESLGRNGDSIIAKKSLKGSTWMQSQIRQKDCCSFLRQTIQYHSNPSLCPNQ